MNITDKDKEALIEKYHDINIDHEWWDCIYDEFKLDMVEKGITVDDMNFTGFYSQGDGASFTGRVDMVQFLKEHNFEQRYMAATFFAGQGELWATIDRGSSRYCHENSVVTCLILDDYNNFEEGSTRYEVYEAMQHQMDIEWKDLEEDVQSTCRSYMQDLYYKLRNEYEHLCSDEVVWETIVANELHEVEAV